LPPEVLVIMASLIRAVATSGARASTFCGVARGGDVRGARAAVWAGARSLRSPAPPFHAHSLPCFVRTWARSGRRAPRAVRSIRIAPVLTWCGRARARARARAWQREPGTSARVAGPNLPRPSAHDGATRTRIKRRTLHWLAPGARRRCETANKS
jgi:hypothetical protein